MRSFLGSYFTARTRHALCVGLICALVVQLFLVLGWLKGMERGTLDTLFRLRSQRYPSSSIVLVVVDEDTVRMLRRWPLQRGVYANTVKRLVRAGAKTIAFDILFSTPSSAEEDRKLVHAVRASRRVVNATAFNVNTAYNPMLPADADPTSRNLPQKFTLTDDGASCRESDWATTPFNKLLEISAGVGHINIHPESDGAVRRIPYLMRYQEEIYPSLALATAANFMEIPLREVVGGPGGIQIADKHIPLDSHGEAWINWTGANNTFPTYSLTQLLNEESYQNLLNEKVFHNRIVLIGVTALGAFEHRSTPFSPLQPSIEIQANAIDNLLQNQPLREATLVAQLFVLLGFSALVAFLVAPRGAVGGTISIAILGLLLWVVAAFAMSRNFYLPVGAPLLAGALTFVTVTTLNYRREWETNWRTDAAITAIARGGALMASGRDRYRLESVICETARDALGVRHVFLALNTPAPQGALSEVLQQVLQEREAIVWPPVSKRDQSSNQELSAMVHRLCDKVHEHKDKNGGHADVCSLLAVPLLGASDRGTSGNSGFYGALIAVDQGPSNREVRIFTERDATLMQTLAEQAALALENLGYYEQLHGRVEAANQELQDAYDLLVDQSTKFIAAVESIDNALIITDENMRAIFVNAACETILLDATPALGDVVPEVLTQHGMAQIAALFESVEADSPEKALCEVIQAEGHTMQPDGQQMDAATRHRSLQAQLTPLGVSDGKLVGAMLVVADVTTQRELDTMKTEFVAFVAHELRNPLGSILGYASLMEMAGDQLQSEQRAEMAAAISRQCHRLNRMISDLLDVARLDAGRPLDLRRAPFDLVALCQKVVDSQRAPLSVSLPITLGVESNGPVMVNADADRIEQIITNLVSNAIKYSPEGGTITVVVSESPQDVVLKVSDTGMGMTPEQSAHLFQKFYRTPESQARGIKGTGLGLYLVKQLVEAHDGTIEVESVHGQGSIFTVTLPRSL